MRADLPRMPQSRYRASTLYVGPDRRPAAVCSSTPRQRGVVRSSSHIGRRLTVKAHSALCGSCCSCCLRGGRVSGRAAFATSPKQRAPWLATAHATPRPAVFLCGASRWSPVRRLGEAAVDSAFARTALAPAGRAAWRHRFGGVWAVRSQDFCPVGRVCAGGLAVA